jgi:hypothetical protein
MALRERHISLPPTRQDLTFDNVPSKMGDENFAESTRRFCRNVGSERFELRPSRLIFYRRQKKSS